MLNIFFFTSPNYTCIHGRFKGGTGKNTHTRFCALWTFRYFDFRRRVKLLNLFFRRLSFNAVCPVPRKTRPCRHCINQWFIKIKNPPVVEIFELDYFTRATLQSRFRVHSIVQSGICIYLFSGRYTSVTPRSYSGNVFQNARYTTFLFRSMCNHEFSVEYCINTMTAPGNRMVPPEICVRHEITATVFKRHNIPSFILHVCLR